MLYTKLQFLGRTKQRTLNSTRLELKSASFHTFSAIIFCAFPAVRRRRRPSTVMSCSRSGCSCCHRCLGCHCCRHHLKKGVQEEAATVNL